MIRWVGMLIGTPVPTDASELVTIGSCGGHTHLHLKVFALDAFQAALDLLCLELQNRRTCTRPAFSGIFRAPDVKSQVWLCACQTGRGGVQD